MKIKNGVAEWMRLRLVQKTNKGLGLLVNTIYRLDRLWSTS